MNYAIIAAGEGSRLVSEGVQSPKPLVNLDGRPMIRRLIDIFVDCGAENISIIVNEQMTEVADYLRQIAPALPVPLRLVVKSTPSSMHSFYEVSRHFPEGSKFILTTVDTIFRPDEFTDYVAAFSRTADSASRALFGVTGLIDDEKPLYVDLIPGTMTVRAFMDTPPLRPRYISAGIYGLHTDSAARAIELCRRRNLVRMRDFQRALLELGTTVTAFPFTDAVDLDHLSDIPADL